MICFCWCLPSWPASGRAFFRGWPWFIRLFFRVVFSEKVPACGVNYFLDRFFMGCDSTLCDETAFYAEWARLWAAAAPADPLEVAGDVPDSGIPALEDARVALITD